MPLPLYRTVPAALASTDWPALPAISMPLVFVASLKLVASLPFVGQPQLTFSSSVGDFSSVDDCCDKLAAACSEYGNLTALGCDFTPSGKDVGPTTNDRAATAGAALGDAVTTGDRSRNCRPTVKIRGLLMPFHAASSL